MNRRSDWSPACLDDAPPLADAGDVQLWLMSLDDPPWPIEQLAGELDAAETDRAARFHFPHLARRYTAAHGMLRRVLARHAGVAARDLRFVLGAAGKPALAGAVAAGWSFNLSHSGGLAVLGLARAPRIGVDIEVMRSMDDRNAIAASHFAASERRELQALPESLQADGFFACWTRKEAWVKALGDGLSIPLADFAVSLDPRAPAVLRIAPGGAAQAARWTLWSASPAPGVWVAAAMDANPAQVHTFRLRAP